MLSAVSTVVAAALAVVPHASANAFAMARADAVATAAALALPSAVPWQLGSLATTCSCVVACRSIDRCKGEIASDQGVDQSFNQSPGGPIRA